MVIRLCRARLFRTCHELPLALLLFCGVLLAAPTQNATAQNPVTAPALAADAVQEAFVRVAERVKPSVVNIVAERRATTASDVPKTMDEAAPRTPQPKNPQRSTPPGKTIPEVRPRRAPQAEQPEPGEEDLPFALPFPFGPRDPVERRTSMGTGMVVSSNGFILTNYHIVKDATTIRVLLDADSEQPDRPIAQLVAFDEESDLAVLKIERTNLPAIEFADSDTVRIGEWAIAIGAPFEQAQTVTVGIVSAKGRHLPSRERLSLQDYIQTDASINPGNSGGPLLNLQGKVIGINTAILSPSRFNVGIGFSVPSNTVRDYLPSLMSGKSILRGFLGINYVRIDREVAREFGVTDGIQIGAMALGPDNKPVGPANAAGLQPGDIITAVDGVAIDSTERFRRIVSSTPPGRAIRLAVVRPSGERTQNMEVTVTLSDWAGQNDSAAQSRRSAPATGKLSRLGMEIVDVTQLNTFERDLFGFESTARGALVRDVEPGSAADDAQISRGNLLVRVRVSGGTWQPITDRATFERIEKLLSAGARLLVEMQSGRGVSLYKVIVAPPVVPFQPARTVANTNP
ncbi:MAG TPA: trypsin-like peptidase domain-containing protein [Abditibacteriaceae bacterium]|jgi:serine protease Do